MAEPARIASVIGGVSSELGRWSVAATSAVEEAGQAVRWGTEHVQRADHTTNIANDLAQQQENTVAREKQSAERTEESAHDAKMALDTQRSAALQLQGFANQTLQAWTGELSKAQSWQQRAQQRVAKAEVWVARAEQRVVSCQASVRSAERSLSSCRSNKERKNCNSEARSLSNAQAELSAAQQDLRRAIAELSEARVELARAIARVQCCQTAVHFAGEAAKASHSSIEQVEEGAHTSELALADAKRAVEAVGRAKDFLEKELAAVERMLSLTVRARRRLDEALAHLRSASDSYQSSQRYAKDAQRDMSLRIERLRDFDRGGL